MPPIFAGSSANRLEMFMWVIYGRRSLLGGQKLARELEDNANDNRSESIFESEREFGFAESGRDFETPIWLIIIGEQIRLFEAGSSLKAAERARTKFRSLTPANLVEKPKTSKSVWIVT